MNKAIYPVVAVLALVTGAWFYQAHQGQWQLSNGQKISASDYQGQWLVINFFAEWCKPCLKELPELNRFNASAKRNNAVLIGVSYDPLTQSQVLELKKKYDIQFDVIVTETRPEFPFEWPKQLPTTFILNPQGQLAGKILGTVTQRKLNNKLSQLAAAKGV